MNFHAFSPRSWQAVAGIKKRNTVLHQMLLLSPEDSIMWVIFFQCHYMYTFKKSGELSVLAHHFYYWSQLITWKLKVSAIRSSISSAYIEKDQNSTEEIAVFVLNRSYWWSRTILSRGFFPINAGCPLCKVRIIITG